MRLCKDCKHKTVFWDVCVVTPRSQDPVSGAWYYEESEDCHYQRSRMGSCGPLGMKYEAKLANETRQDTP